MMFISRTPYLQSETDFNALLFNQLALIAVSLPILAELPLPISILFAVFALGRVALLKFGVKALARWQLLLMLGTVGILVFLQVGTFIGLQGGMAFLLLLCALKSYEGYTRRDRQVSALSMMFLLTGAVLFNQSLLVGLWVLVCLMLIATSLAVLNELNIQAAFKQSAMAFLLTLLPMLLLFITMPRRDAPLWGLPQNPANQSTTGLSDTMKPGSIGDLVQSNEPAFSATFQDGFVPRPQDLYWRVMIMANRSEDGTWQAMSGVVDNALPDSSRHVFNVAYQIVIEDDKGRLPALDYPATEQRRGIMRESGNVLRIYSRKGVRGIQLKSTISNELPQHLLASEKRRYLQLNENTNLRTMALAKQLFAQSGEDAETFANAAFQYFANNQFVYTLKPPILGSKDSTDEFIFNSKQGFCEHYADAFVTMMRSAGVPARVVTGYQGGEWNEQGGFWQIRSKDAHAWAEVWLEKKNVWKRIDPTAAVSITRVAGGLDDALPAEEIKELVNNLSWWSRFSDQSQIYWQRWVVNFDGEQQRNLFSLFGFSQVNAWTILTVLIMGLLPAFIPVWLWWKRSRSKDISPLADGFMLLKRRLLGKDFVHLPALSVLELKAELNAQQRLSPDLDSLLNEYIRLNYASAQTPNPIEARVWYRRARALSRKYRLKNS
ncbi:transglutaminaseTgpA domain-containing protein [Wielerella bovis]|uniref:transglutaminase family protein n=1 Tax=Wielerella bovis TaxID=2917790 RepID=UPI002019297D|nr:DUF3488 and transglutaminase-like domain-containing protein [Wielerella bovis]ULJ63798.1 DUF3488 and transglutaminase-like domain-containing protein [Wielerella bovis]ULJ66034.1 DUF3488 and transglutaminase-like domain-containing protein [Wielerella bovis]